MYIHHGILPNILRVKIKEFNTIEIKLIKNTGPNLYTYETIINIVNNTTYIIPSYWLVKLPNDIKLIKTLTIYSHTLYPSPYFFSIVRVIRIKTTIYEIRVKEDK